MSRDDGIVVDLFAGGGGASVGLSRALGFDDSYVIDPVIDGRPITQTEQIRLAGNSVCPDVMEAIARANHNDRIAEVA